MQKRLVILCMCQWFSLLYSQENIIPNPSFENFTDEPTSWFFNGSHFTNLVTFWCSPTLASPDAYDPHREMPTFWSERGFGKVEAYDGDRMVGITMYGCKKGKPHCKEYIQIRLSEPLVVNQSYTFSIWVAHFENGLYVNNLGIHLSSEEITQKVDTKLNVTPQLNFDKIIRPPHRKWQKLTVTFKASEEYEFITIGNFFSDGKTNFLDTYKAQQNYAYYYLDDLSLTKKQPIIPTPDRKHSLTNVKLEKGKTIVLDNIYFDHDRTDFLSRSYDQLDNLVEILNQNPLLKIQIQGHTDNRGDSEYNNQLSNYRASAVVQYLVQRGISSHRLTYRGYGSNQPISTNNTDEGRKRNRRVEFLIVDK